MKLELRPFLPWVLPALMLAFVLLAGNALAADTATDGTVGLKLAQGLFCDTKNLLEGYLGLTLGLLLVLSGIWSLTSGGSPKTAFTLILFGALITSLPSLIISTMEGFGDLMEKSGLSSSWEWVTPDQCKNSSSGGSSTTTTPVVPEEMDDDDLWFDPSAIGSY